MEKICGFYINDVHLVTMILPYLREQLKNEIKIETFFENSLKEHINNILSSLIIDEKRKEDIKKINWEKNKIKKYYNLEKELDEKINKNDEAILLIGGNKNYIKEINNILNKYLEKNNNKNIKIINCYQISLFDDDITEILDKNEYVLNTSGIHKIEEIFENYKKKITK